MNIDILQLIEHGSVAVVLWGLIQFMLIPLINRLMDRLDTLTDKLIEMAQNQEQIIKQQSLLIETVRPSDKPSND